MANETDNQSSAPVGESAPDYNDPPPNEMTLPSEGPEDVYGVDLVSMTSRLGSEAFDRLGAAMASAVQQTAGLKSIRMAGGGKNRPSRYAPAVHSFVAQLQAELQQLFDE